MNFGKNGRLDQDVVGSGGSGGSKQPLLDGVQIPTVFFFFGGGNGYVECGISHAKIAELIELPFGEMNEVDPRNRSLCGHAYWRHLANTVERLCAAAITGTTTGDGDAACSQITLGNAILL